MWLNLEGVRLISQLGKDKYHTAPLPSVRGVVGLSAAALPGAGWSCSAGTDFQFLEVRCSRSLLHNLCIELTPSYP